MRRLLCLLCVSALAACSASEEKIAATADGGAKTDGGGFDPGGDDGGIALDADLPESPPPDEAPAAAVYAHSATTLYKLDPDTKAVLTIGTFSGCSQVVDIAVDKDSNIFGSTQSGGIYRIDNTTAKCTSLGGGSFAGNSLSFVPVGVLDPAKEILVTYNGGDYYRVDPTTGATKALGSLPSGYSSSGDIVSVKGGGTYVTVNGNGCGDCLLEVDPKTGAMKKNWGSVGAAAVYGIAYWAGSVYTFDNSGKIFELSFGTSSVTATAIPIPSKPSGLSFWGAGSTTSAPIVKVK